MNITTKSRPTINDKINIDIVVISSHYFIRYTSTMICSLLSHLGKNSFCNFYILEQDLDNNDKNKLNKIIGEKCNIEYIKVENEKIQQFFNIKVSNHVINLTYAKVLLPDILPELNKVLFLDSDLLILDDITKLWEMDFNNNLIYAAEDVGTSYISERLWGKGTNKIYFNTGVMLIDLEGLRKYNYKEVINSLSKEQVEKYKIGEQDIISDAFNNKISSISLKWNMYHKYHPNFVNYKPSHKTDTKETCNHPYIVHFVGPDKPWIDGIEHEYKKEYIKYFKINPFYCIKDELKHLKKIFYSKKVKDNFTINKYFLGLYSTKQSDYYKEKSLFGIKFYKKDFLEQKIFDHINFIYDSYRNEQKQSLVNFIDYTNCIIQAQTLHKETFAQYKNCFTGRDVVLVATGPSALKYKAIEDAVHIGVNGAVYLNNINLDFVFVQDNTINQPGNENLTKAVLNYSKNNCKKFIGIPSPAIRKINLEQEKQILPIPVSYTNLENTAAYLLMDIENTNDMPYDISREPIANLYGTPFSAMQFILYTNPRRVYLVGCDCSSGYAYDINKKNYLSLSPQIESWKIIKKYAYLYFPDIEIISINPVGLKEIFKDEYTDSNFRRI